MIDFANEYEYNKVVKHEVNTKFIKLHQKIKITKILIIKIWFATADCD